jgi:acetylornithine/N-succinyldiaminopimelate aminotransferase
LAALVAREEVCCFEHGDQGGTFNGNPLMTAVGSAVMDATLAPGFLDHVNAMGERITAGLRAMSARRGLGEVRGRGLLIAIDLGQDIAGKVVDAARDEGLLLNAPRPNLIRLMPALNVTAEEVDTMLQITERCVQRVLATA